MSNRRAQDERIEGTPDGSNAITEIVDVPDAPIIGTATAGVLGASVPFTAATTGGTVSTYTATSTPGSITGTSATSPITVSGLTGGTAYTFTVTPSNSTGTGPASSSSNSITPVDLVGAYDSLFTVTLSSTASSVTFSNIPSTYTHLQIRMFTQSNRATYGSDSILGTFNGDTGSNYAYHALRGDGASASAINGATQSRFYLYGSSATSAASAYTFGGAVMDILDYANTNKYKTIRCLAGADQNGTVATYGGPVALSSSLWQNTNAVTSINLAPESGTLWNQYSSFALYGVK